MSDRAVLEEMGLTPRWDALFAPHAKEGLVLARAIRADRGSVLAATADGLMRAKASARLVKRAAGPGDLPAVGDWLALLATPSLEVPLVEAVLARASAIARGDPSSPSDVQVLAANVDTVFVAHSIATDPNLRRVERELSLAWDSGAVPVVVLTKADLSPDPEAAYRMVASVALGVELLLTSAVAEGGADPLLSYLTDRRTAVLIGPSGAGKSTLINALLGQERQPTREVRVSDGRGRHTTVSRELVRLPGGGLLIDTPGLRALGLTGSEDGVSAAFSDIGEAARSCRFADCSHTGEPGCAVLAAVEAGRLPAVRLASYHKLLREAQVAAARTDARLRAEEQRKWKTIAKAAREFRRQDGRS